MAISGGDGSIILTTKVEMSGLKKGLNSIKTLTSSTGKAFAAIGVAAAAATVAITKMAVSAYADYEQLVGGVETLFKGSAQKVIDYANRQIRAGALSQEHAQLIYDGFSMLDEATTQDRAEDFVYSFSGKARPQQQNVRSQRLFNGQAYRSNFDYYGELQAPATMFARTLRGIGKEDNDAKALKLLSSRALSPDFFNTILSEYTRDGQMPAFIREVQYMGLLKRASYANFGAEDISYCRNSSRYLSELTNITSQMRDWREPFVNTGDGR